jgi:S1-C subfamily serine protease
MRPRLSSRFVLLTLTVLLGVPGAGNAQATLSRGEIDRISRSVVRIVTLDNGEELASGSGTIVQATGEIFTNRHVIEDGDDFEIQLLVDPNDLPVPSYRARLVGYSADVDFAILQIDRDAGGSPIDAAGLSLPFLTPSDPDVQRGDRIFVFGYPGIGEGYLAFTDGTVTTIRNGTMNDERMPVWYQTDAEISPGNSGGLVVNASSEIVGIPTQVLMEEGTGGRLGGILPINAAEAAMTSGLESDMAGIEDGTTSPVLTDGRLDVSEAPTFGTVSLAAGFTPDPHTVEMLSGGEVEANYLGGGCTGYAAVAPDYRLNWSGDSDELRVFYAAADGSDTTLLINLPDGEWVCDDDSDSGLDPLIEIQDPLEGQYDIWVASYSAGDFIDGTLHITELDLEPNEVGADELDLTLEPFFGSTDLEAGFLPDPFEIDMTSGGSIDVEYLGGSCVGFAATAPDFRLNWSGSSDELRIFFESDDDSDATMIVNLPNGDWVCDDDADGTLNPMVTVEDPSEGQFDIWVGSYSRGEFISGTLSITERDLGPG